MKSNEKGGEEKGKRRGEREKEKRSETQATKYLTTLLPVPFSPLFRGQKARSTSAGCTRTHAHTQTLAHTHPLLCALIFPLSPPLIYIFFFFLLDLPRWSLRTRSHSRHTHPPVQARHDRPRQMGTRGTAEPHAHRQQPAHSRAPRVGAEQMYPHPNNRRSPHDPQPGPARTRRGGTRGRAPRVQKGPTHPASPGIRGKDRGNPAADRYRYQPPGRRGRGCVGASRSRVFPHVRRPVWGAGVRPLLGAAWGRRERSRRGDQPV